MNHCTTLYICFPFTTHNFGKCVLSLVSAQLRFSNLHFVPHHMNDEAAGEMKTSVLIVDVAVSGGLIPGFCGLERL